MSWQIFFFAILMLVPQGFCCAGTRARRGKAKNDNGNGNQNNPPNNNPGTSNNGIQNMLGNNVNINPDDNSGFDAKGGQASNPSDLQCSFEAPCCWKNEKPPFDTMEFLKASGSPDADKFQKNFGTSTTPSGNFLLTMTNAATSPADKAEYVSCTIPCAGDSIQVSMKHWTTGGVKLQVCETASSDPSTLLGCQELPSNGPGPDTVNLPPGSNLNIVIVADNFLQSGGNMAIVDDISVQYPPCGGDPTPPITQQPQPQITDGPPPVVVGGDCKNLLCDFESGNCNYNTGSGPIGGTGGGSSKGFENHVGRLNNPATGVPPAPDGSHYAGAYLKPKESAYMEAESNFDNDRVIKFQEYKATQDIALKACCDTTTGCSYDTGANVKKSDYKQWFQGAIQCPKGTRKVIFFAQNNGPNEGGVGIDNIQVFQPSGGDPNSASQAMC